MLCVATLQSHSMWAMVFGMSFVHMWHLSSMSAINLAFHELFAIALCQMKPPSFPILVLSQTFPHFNFSWGVRMPCHSVVIDQGGPCFEWGAFLPMTKVFNNSSHDFHWIWVGPIPEESFLSSINTHARFPLSHTNGAHSHKVKPPSPNGNCKFFG